MALTKTNTQNNTKTRRTPRRNRHLEKKTQILFCVFRIFMVYFYFLFTISSNNEQTVLSLSLYAGVSGPLTELFAGCLHARVQTRSALNRCVYVFVFHDQNKSKTAPIHEFLCAFTQDA